MRTCSTCVEDESVPLARTHCARKSLTARWFPAMFDVFIVKMRVASSRLYFKDFILIGQNAHVESASSHIVQQHVSLTGNLLV